MVLPNRRALDLVSAVRLWIHSWIHRGPTNDPEALIAYFRCFR
jgi:hypothetical protein